MAPYTMNEPLDNAMAETGAGPWGALQASDGPQALARRMVGARDRQGTLRPCVQFVARGDQDVVAGHLRQLRGLLENNELEDALALGIERLGPRHRDEQMRRTLFALLERKSWRKRLMPLLRRHVVARNLDPVPGGLFLYGLLQAGKMPREGLTSPLVWAYSLVWLLDHCEPEDICRLARHIADEYPRITFLADVANGLEQVPPKLPHDAFHDHWMADIELARAQNPASRNLLICFTGMFGRMGTPIGVFHRWASRADAHVVYLKDLRRNFYRAGVASLSREGFDPREDLALFLRAMADELDAQHVGIYGISMGGIPAVETGLAIGADRVVWAAGAIEREDQSLPFNDPGEVARRTRTGEELLAKIAAAPQTPEIACVYGENFPHDAEMPTVLSAHASVQLHPLSGLSDHNIDFHLVKAGRFDRLVGWAAGVPGPLDLT